MLTGSIAPLGSAYVITLIAKTCATGDTIATEQVQAGRKEDVLKKMGTAASALRERLGESLASIAKFDVPIEQATTSSLEALKAFTTGVQLHASGQPAKAIPQLERAIELDPHFAPAYAQMGTSYRNLRISVRAREVTTKAYAFRDRVTERERFYIDARYFDSVTGELDRVLTTYELWIQTYPRDYVPFNNIGVTYVQLGELEKAIDAYRTSQRLNPQNALVYGNIAFAYLTANRVAEARTAFDEAVAKYPRDPTVMVFRVALACLTRNADDLRRHTDTALREPNLTAVVVAGSCAIQEGRMSDAWALEREIRQLSDENARESQRRVLGELASAECAYGRCARGRAAAVEAVASLPDDQVPATMLPTLAEVGETDRLRRISARLQSIQPNGTHLTSLVLPLVAATQALADNRPQAAIDSLAPAERFGRLFAVVRLTKGLALLRARSPSAAAEFQRIVDTQEAIAVILYGYPYPCALVGLARARTASGDSPGARQAYEKLLDLWKHADQDLPLLADVRRELAAVPPSAAKGTLRE